MAYFKNTPTENDGKISYNVGIVDGIVMLAISEVEGVSVASSKSVSVKGDKNGLLVNVDVIVDHLVSVSEIAYKIQENIKHNVESMSEYHIAKVNVNVTGVMFNDEPTPQNN